MPQTRTLATGLLGLVTALSGIAPGASAAAAPTSFEVRGLAVAPTALSPNGDGTLDSATAAVSVDVLDSMDLRWWVETPAGLRTGVSGSVDDVAPNDRREIEFTLDPTGLSDGDYRVQAEVKYGDAPTWLGSERSARDEGGFTIDLTAPPAPVLERTSTRRFYPVWDTYRDVATFDIPTAETEELDYDLIVTDEGGEEVYRNHTWWRPEEFGWEGIDRRERVVPEGDYWVRVEIHDATGNPNVSNKVPVTVSRKRLVWRWWKRKVTPAASLVDRHVGHCSTLSRPSARGWAGSIGLYSDTPCRSSSDPSVVSTVHSLRMRRAMKYGQLRVAVDGGAATSAPSSVAVLSYLTGRGHWDASVRLAPSLRHHPGQTESASYFIGPGRRFSWGLVVAGGARYDVRLFTVKLHYMVLGYRGRCILC